MISLRNRTARLIRDAATLFYMALIPAGVFAATDFSALIPGDALVAGWAPDFAELKKAAADSPYGKLYNDPASDKLREFIGKKWDEMKADMGEKDAAKFQEAMGQVKGGIAFYIMATPNFVKEDGVDPVTFTGMLETDDASQAWIQEQLKTTGADLQNPVRDSYEVDGVTINRIKGTKAVDAEQADESPTPTADASVPTTEAMAPTAETPAPSAIGKEETTQYAFVDNMFIITNGSAKDALQSAIARLKGNEAASAGDLKHRPEAATVAGHLAPDADHFTFFVNSGKFLKLLEEKSKAESAEAADWYSKMQSSGLFDIDTIYFSNGMHPNSVTTDVAMVTPNGRHGILQALTSTSGTTMDMAKLAPADALGVTSFSLDLGALWDAGTKLSEEISPGSSSFANMMAINLQSKYGVDILNGIIKNIAGEHLFVKSKLDEATLAALGPEEAALSSSRAFYLGLKNSDETVKNIKALFDALQKDPDYGSAIEVKDENGVTVVRMKELSADAGPLRPALAVTSTGVVFTNNEVELQNSLRAIAGNLPNPLSKDSSFGRSMGEADKKNLLLFGYAKGDAVSSVSALCSYLAASGAGDMDGFQADMIPSKEVIEKYIGDMSTSVNATDDGLILKTKLSGPAPVEN
ncbi:hypothetical protein BH09SUM1_BH09SUM1_17560 [soil metagenome]